MQGESYAALVFFKTGGDSLILLFNPKKPVQDFFHQAQPANTDWIRFSPTNAVKRYQYGLAHVPNARLIKIKLPAINLIHFSMVIDAYLNELYVRGLLSVVRGPWSVA